MSGKRNLPADIRVASSDASGLFTNDYVLKAQEDISELFADSPVQDSICVDASTISNPGPTEYRGVDMQTKAVLFQYKLDEATNNIGEFLAIVHALALVKKEKIAVRVIYSDSANAISWIRQKKCKTKYVQHKHNKGVFDLIKRAITWLECNTYETKVIKWNTAEWGEIPADYGRK